MSETSEATIDALRADLAAALTRAEVLQRTLNAVYRGIDEKKATDEGHRRFAIRPKGIQQLLATLEEYSLFFELQTARKLAETVEKLTRQRDALVRELREARKPPEGRDSP